MIKKLDLLQKISDESLEKMRLRCISLASEHQTLNNNMGMKPYYMWVDITSEQVRRDIERHAEKRLLRKKNSEQRNS